MNSRVSPFAPVPIDVLFRNICWHLDIQDLGRLMRVNRLFWETFIVDAAWQHFYQILIHRMPNLQEHVFAKYPWHSTGEKDGERDTKRAKFASNKGAAMSRVFIMPKGGVWYVMRHFIVPACSVEGLKKLCVFTTKPHFRSDTDPSRWSRRDQTIQDLLPILFAGLQPTKLNAHCFERARIRPTSRVWFSARIILNGHAILQVALHHGNVTKVAYDLTSHLFPGETATADIYMEDLFDPLHRLLWHRLRFTNRAIVEHMTQYMYDALGNDELSMEESISSESSSSSSSSSEDSSSSEE